MEIDKKILVTGANGRFGSALCQALVKKKYKIIGTYHKKFNDNLNFKWIKVDLEKRNKLNLDHPDVVVHLAAVTGVNDKKALIVNQGGTKHLLDSLPKRKILFIYFSSVEAYGDSSNTIASPTNIYGKSKLLAEEEIIKYKKAHKNFYYVILRPGYIVESRLKFIKTLNKLLIKLLGKYEINFVENKWLINKIIKIINTNQIEDKIKFAITDCEKIGKTNIFYSFLGEILATLMRVTRKGGFYYYLVLHKHRNYPSYD